MKSLTFVLILISLFFSSCLDNNRKKNDSICISQDYQADFLWLEGWLTYCTMMEKMGYPNNILTKIYKQLFPEFTKEKQSNVLHEIKQFTKDYPLKRLDYGYLNANGQWEIRGVIAIYEYDPTTELRYVFCFDSTYYFRIPKGNPSKEENIEYTTKKTLENELDKKRKYTLYKYLMKIEGVFIPIEELIHIETEE